MAATGTPGTGCHSAWPEVPRPTHPTHQSSFLSSASREWDSAGNRSLLSAAGGQREQGFWGRPGLGLPALGWGQGGLSLWGWGCRGQHPSLTLLVPFHRPCEPPRQGVPAAGAGACRGPGLVRVQGAPARPAVRHLPQRQLGASHHPWCVVCGMCACMRACLVCVLRVHEPPPHALGLSP